MAANEFQLHKVQFAFQANPSGIFIAAISIDI